MAAGSHTGPAATSRTDPPLPSSKASGTGAGPAISTAHLVLCSVPGDDAAEVGADGVHRIVLQPAVVRHNQVGGIPLGARRGRVCVVRMLWRMCVVGGGCSCHPGQLSTARPTRCTRCKCISGPQSFCSPAPPAAPARATGRQAGGQPAMPSPALGCRAGPWQPLRRQRHLPCKSGARAHLLDMSAGPTANAAAAAGKRRLCKHTPAQAGATPHLAGISTER